LPGGTRLHLLALVPNALPPVEQIAHRRFVWHW